MGGGVVVRLALVVALPLMAGDVRVQVRTGTGVEVIELGLDRYVEAVVAGESGVFRSEEALKAMAVAARTYAVRMRGRHVKDGFDFCDTTHCQRLELGEAGERVRSAVEQTAGEMLWYRGRVAFTPYTRDCGGRSEAAAAIWPDLGAPYLKIHEDPNCRRAGSAAWHWSGDAPRILRALKDSGLRAPEGLNRVVILDRTASGRAATLDLMGVGGSVRISADSFRFAIGRELGWNTVRSDQYQVRASNGRMVFDGEGSGHGVGLCQMGAERMGEDGRTYREILEFYYPATVVGVTARGFLWQRLSGDSMVLMATRDEDRAVLGLAERIERGLVERTRWAPQRMELRVYPDVDSFRNATGEPGWVAAHTEGRTIHLQPAPVLRARGTLERMLRHEIAHVLMEAQGGSPPLWFEEGLAAFLESGAGAGKARVPAEGDLRQTSDAARARRAYAEAQAEVGELVARYGEAAVFDWARRGLPAEVAKASASQTAAKSK